MPTDAPPRPPDAPPESAPPAPPAWVPPPPQPQPSPAASDPLASREALRDQVLYTMRLTVEHIEDEVATILRYLRAVVGPEPPRVPALRTLPPTPARPLASNTQKLFENWPSRDDQTPYRRQP